MRWSGRKLVAVDYDRRQLRLAVSRPFGDEHKVLSLHCVPFPGNANSGDPAVVGRLLKTAIDELHLRGSDAVMSVGRGQVVLKSLCLPPALQDHEIASMVQFQVAKELPFGADEAVVDFTHGGHWEAETSPAPAPDSTLLTAAAVKLPIVDAARQIAQAAGLNLKRLALRPFANLSAVTRCVKTAGGEGVLFIYVSADEAEIDILRDGQVEFSRSVLIASVQSAGVEGAEVSTESEQVDLADPDGVARRIANEAQRSLQSFQAVQHGSNVSACLVAGHTGCEEQLRRQLSGRLGVTCEPFRPAPAYGVSGPDDGSGYAVALGLASGDDKAYAFDFANPKRPSPPRDTRREKLLAAVGGTAVILAAFVIAHAHYIGQPTKEVAQLSAQVKELQDSNKVLKKLSDHVASVERWRKQEPAWLDQLAYLSNLMPGPEEVYLSSFKSNTGQFTIEVRAKDDKSLTRFTQDLKSTSGYEPEPKGTSPTADRFGYVVKSLLEVAVGANTKPNIASSQPVGRPEDDSYLKPQTPPAAPNAPANPAPAAAGAAKPATDPAADRPRRARRAEAP